MGPMGPPPEPERPARSAESGGDPAYLDWLANRDKAAAEATAPPPPEPAPPATGPGAEDADYQEFLASKRAAEAAMADPEYRAWKESRDAEAQRIADLGPSCPYCHALATNPTGEKMPYCWACGYGSLPDQRDKYAEAVRRDDEVPA